MNFLADENISNDSINLLIKNGHSVYIVDKELRGAKDIDILSKAVKEKLIILTFDKDFGELIFKENLTRPPGVVLFRIENNLPEDAARILLNSIKVYDITLKNNFTVIEDNNIRQRKF